MKTNLLNKTNEILEDMNNNRTWFEREVSFVIDGSHISGEATYYTIIDKLDTTKKRFGKRGYNLIAYVGNQALQDIYSLTPQQVDKAWSYMDSESKQYFDDLVKDLLIDLESELKGE